MEAAQERFCCLRKNVTFRVGRVDADFLIALMHSFEMSTDDSPTISKRQQVTSISFQANSSREVFQRESRKDVACRVPELSAPDCRQVRHLDEHT